MRMQKPTDAVGPANQAVYKHSLLKNIRYSGFNCAGALPGKPKTSGMVHLDILLFRFKEVHIEAARNLRDSEV